MAVVEYTKALQLNPHHFKALFNRGFSYDKVRGFSYDKVDTNARFGYRKLSLGTCARCGLHRTVYILDCELRYSLAWIIKG